MTILRILPVILAEHNLAVIDRQIHLSILWEISDFQIDCMDVSLFMA